MASGILSDGYVKFPDIFLRKPFTLFLGDLLVSTGDDGAIRTWKRAVNNKWLEYAEIDVARDH